MVDTSDVSSRLAIMQIDVPIKIFIPTFSLLYASTRASLDGRLHIPNSKIMAGTRNNLGALLIKIHRS